MAGDEVVEGESARSVKKKQLKREVKKLKRLLADAEAGASASAHELELAKDEASRIMKLKVSLQGTVQQLKQQNRRLHLKIASLQKKTKKVLLRLRL